MDGHPSPYDLWGKLRTAQESGSAWHPLVDHCIDVASVLRELLRYPVIRQRLSRAAGLGDLETSQVDRLCFLAFLHDLGKCARGFQAKADPSPRAVCGHIAALRAMDEPNLRERFGQALDLASLEDWADPETFCSLLIAVFSHHGRPLGLEGLSFNPFLHHPLAGAWGEDAHADPMLDLAKLAAAGRSMFPGAFTPGGEPLPAAPGFAHLFAGLLMLADWLGSDDRHFFPFSERGAARAEQAPHLAARAAEKVGLDTSSLRRRLADGPPSFRAQFGFSPRSAQGVIDRLALPDPGGVVLLESETGSGKTEAALRWAMRLMAAGDVDGLFLAVPLRSAAVQLHARVERWRKATFGADGPEVLLAVPGHYRVGAAEGRALPGSGVQWTDSDTRDPKESRWAAEHPKRYAAAAFSVGTIDQALLAVLKVKHAHLRAACLIRHLMVVDEVHASDPYMRELVLRLIELFRACGGQVFLMSATLGAETRELLLHGRRAPNDRAVAEALPYPLISASDRAPVHVEPDGRRKRVAVEASPLIDDPDGIAALVTAAAAADRRVLVLRNTVGAAIATALAVERALGDTHAALFRVGRVATLHHGRFAAEDRRLLDAEVERRCGRDAPAGGAVIVATQTLEQSLDVDFDLLITDLCPIDVLLQRIGRLWRHQREGRAGDAPCVVLAPAVTTSHPS